MRGAFALLRCLGGSTFPHPVLTRRDHPLPAGEGFARWRFGFVWRVPRLRFGFVCALALVAGIVRGQDDAGKKSPLPLTRVVLFSSSVGYLEHRGELEGNRQIEFEFKSSNINDLLKSLVVQDRDGGLVTSVNYSSPEPLTRTLSNLAVDLTQTPTLAQIFEQLRGHEVRLEAPAAIQGIIVGVETRHVPLGSGLPGTYDVDVLNLQTAEGLQSVRIESIVRTRFADARTEREFRQSLALLGQARDNDQKRVKLDFRGAGKRTVSVGYIQEAPVWKTSYRLVLAEGETPFLQGWAIVENASAQDWQDVQLTLVSGRPISFLMDLYQPLYLSRPIVKAEQHAALRPRVHDQDLTLREKEFEKAAAAMTGRARRAAGEGGGMGGGMMGGGFGAGSASGGAAYGMQDPFATPGTAAPVEDLDLTKGVVTAALAGEVGELFRYFIQAPVTLQRNESATLPIVNDAVQGEKVSIFNPAVHGKHPLAGFKLTNTTPLHLLQGPITLFDGGEYAGDARIEDLPPGSTRLVSYALDLDTEMAVDPQPVEQTTLAVAIRKGVLHLKHQFTRQVQYTVKNSGQREKDVLIERPIEAGWRLAEPAATETTRSLWRLAVSAAPGKPAIVKVREEREAGETAVLAKLSREGLLQMTMLTAASPTITKNLQEALARLRAVEESTAARTAVQGLIAGLTEEQDRLRKNLQAVPDYKAGDLVTNENRKASGDLLQRYFKKLDALENELEKEYARLEELRREESRLQQELADFWQRLDVE